DDGEDRAAERPAEALHDVDLGGGIGQLGGSDCFVSSNAGGNGCESDGDAEDGEQSLEYDRIDFDGQQRKRQGGTRGDGGARGHDSAAAVAVGEPSDGRESGRGTSP